MNNSYSLSAILINSDNKLSNSIIEIIGTLKEQKSDPTSIPLYSFNVSNQETYENIKEILLSIMSSNIPISKTFSIDNRILQDDEMINILRQMFENKNIDLRIIGDSYELTENDLNKLSFFNSITANKISPDLKRNSSIENSFQCILNNHLLVEENNLFKREVSLPKDFLYNNNDTMDLNYFLTKNLSQDEINQVVNNLNNDTQTDCNKKIYLRYYNPAEYKEILTKLKNANLNKDIEIILLGNPLYDETIAFKDLSNIFENKISINYSTCQDMINLYCQEPFTSLATYESELEGGGITDLNNYLNVLNLMETAQKHIKEKNYSPLEAQVYAYRYIKQNYIYDPDSEYIDSIDYDINRSLDSIVNRDRMVCVGFSTLYSALMRRIGIPTFRYSTNGHVRNITRIKDEKYKVDNIGILDATYDVSEIDDLGERINQNLYEYFLLPPEVSLKLKEFITIPATLVLDEETLNNHIHHSKSPIQEYYNTFYDPRGYTYTMLKLMGYNISSWDEYKNLINELNRNNTLKAIDPNILKEAIKNVELRENPNLTQEELRNIITEVEDSLNYRNTFKDITPQILINYDEDNHLLRYENQYLIDVEPIKINHDIENPINIFDDNREEPLDDNSTDNIKVFDEEYIAGTNMKKPHDRDIYETDEEYIEYLKNYYDNIFNNDKNSTYHLIKSQIIQDLPINSKEESIFETLGMSEEEILDAQNNIGRLR